MTINNTLSAELKRKFEADRLKPKDNENNFTNCKDALDLRINFSYANYLLTLKSNQRPINKQEFLKQIKVK